MTRNPKDLRGMVESNQKHGEDGDKASFGEQMLLQTDYKDMETNLSKLRSLSEDDKTENAMLRSRLNEQSQLIMILKQRADEATLSVRGLERANKELTEFRDGAEEDLKLQLKKFNILDTRFMELAGNHEEMIRIKDEYKNRNKGLMAENARLKEDNAKLFSKTIEDRNMKIAALENSLQEIRSNYISLESKYRDVLKTSHEAEEKSKKENADLLRRIKETEEALKESQRKLQQQVSSLQNMDQSSQMKLMTMTKEKDDMLELAMSRGKIIQEKQAENKKLQQKIFDMEKNVQNMQEKFERDAALVDVNLQVRRLRAELSDMNYNYDNAMQEFTAYRKHSTTLLEKEKELNARLRQLMT